MNRGADGTFLPDEAVVLRMCYASRYAKDLSIESGSGALAIAFSAVFVLSTEDKTQTPPHLSVYESSLTTPEQARELTGGDKNLVLLLPVDSVRDLKNPNFPEHVLNVSWFQAFVLSEDKYVPDTRIGSEGHCGITGLKRPPAMPRLYWKWFRVKLADIAIAKGILRLS